MLPKPMRKFAFILPLFALALPLDSAAYAQTAAQDSPANHMFQTAHKHAGKPVKKAAAQPAATIEVRNAYARAMMPGSQVGAGYFEIKNNSNAPIRLVSVESPAAEKVEIHSMSMDGNVAKMRKLSNGIEIPPHSGLSFQPGSYHLMFINPQKPFAEGEKISAQFVFADGARMTVPFKVRAFAKAAKNEHMGGMKKANAASAK